MKVLSTVSFCYLIILANIQSFYAINDVQHYFMDQIFKQIAEWEIVKPRSYDELLTISPKGDLNLPRVRGQNIQSQFLQLFNPNTDNSQQYSNCPELNENQLRTLSRMCPREAFFYGMNHNHMKAVGKIQQMMMAQPSAEDVICTARKLHNSQFVNRDAYVRVLMTTVLNRPDMQGLNRPSFLETMPSFFVNSAVLNTARQMANNPTANRGDACIVLDGSQGVANGIENALWYFREDVMVNSHHWYWHLANPFLPMVDSQGRRPARPDRRGELFYYMHHSFLSRYHSERLSNGLGRFEPVELIPNTVIRQPYYANLDGTNSGQRWTDREPNARIQDIFLLNTIAEPDTLVNISINVRLEQLRRIKQGIETGFLLAANNQIVPLNNFRGVDILGEAIEASIYSVNPNFYGTFGIHNDGHVIIGLIQDPQGRRRLPPGVMSDAATSMRDPLFYNYHLPIAGLIDLHKHQLPPYHPTEGEYPLIWKGVEITDVQVYTSGRNPNQMTTFMNSAYYDLSRGLDFNRSTAQNQPPIMVCVRHLDHEPFEYQILVNKDQNVESNLASVRIFLAPKYDENGQAYTLLEQRDLFFPMDFFTVRLSPGRNIIERKSEDSSLTITWPQRLEELEREPSEQTPDCGCGWPAHLLIPKGTAKGMDFELFVMLTNGEEDAVPQQATQAPGSRPRPQSCRPAPIFCGIPCQLYPDSKPMGYPIDRLPYFVQDLKYDTSGNPYYSHYSQETRRINTLDEYANEIPNAAFRTVTIRHLG